MGNDDNRELVAYSFGEEPCLQCVWCMVVTKITPGKPQKHDLSGFLMAKKFIDGIFCNALQKHFVLI